MVTRRDRPAPLDVESLGDRDVSRTKVRSLEVESLSGHLSRLLRLGGERRKSEAERENNRKPDQPHGTSVEDGWRESS
jgi:hypothetical protein